MALQPSVVEALLVLVFMFGAGIFGIILGIALMVFAGLNAHWVTALVAIPLAWLVWPFMINLVRPRMRKIVNFLESKEDPSEEKKELG
jgi:cell division protein FtsW (lipid II flippase)